jgi:uncharacterized protein YcgI (DUF1989 family)
VLDPGASPPDEGPFALVLPGGSGLAFRVRRGQRLTIAQTSGQQVVDLVSVVEGAAPPESLSMVYSRIANRSWRLAEGDLLCSDRARDLFRVVEVAPAAEHYTGGGFCGPEINERRFGDADGPSCRANLVSAFAPFGVDGESLGYDSCLNAFMTVRYDADGAFVFAESSAAAGEVLALEALADQLVGLSCCPQERGPTNAGALKPVHVRREG